MVRLRLSGRYEDERMLHLAVDVLLDGAQDLADKGRLCRRDLQHEQGGQQEGDQKDQDPGDYF